MKFCIITHVSHGFESGNYFAYEPYVREMNIWSKFIDDLVIVAPITSTKSSNITAFYKHENINFHEVPSIELTSFASAIKSLFLIPKICFSVFKVIKKSDHIHLRCPGNIGLLGCIVQIFFSSKFKTAKYAGNWDPKSKQPISYKFQKWLLSNTFLTKNMKVLVYGEWENQSKNIKPFFTASYKNADIKNIEPRNFKSTIKFLFVGTLVAGKNPLYAIQLVHELYKKGVSVQLDLFGEGIERTILETYIKNENLQNVIHLKGNQTSENLEKAYQESHFVILASKSEGWPKAVAEGMFWGCVPIATKISCVPTMLGDGKRGLFLNNELTTDTKLLIDLLSDEIRYQQMAIDAMNWSRNYTLDTFEKEIKLLLLNN
jgi:glycosyltransferase involved in cell wall biosynthesis